jgi:predicted transcriptional regulator
MIIPYEIIFRSALPTIRFMIARKLIEEHNYTQTEAANKLGITQAAISNYIRRTRAVALNLDNNMKIRHSINEITQILVKNTTNKHEIIEKITEICDYMRSNKLLCEFHKKLEPSYDTGECQACNKSFIYSF